MLHLTQSVVMVQILDFFIRIRNKGSLRNDPVACGLSGTEHKANAFVSCCQLQATLYGFFKAVEPANLVIILPQMVNR